MYVFNSAAADKMSGDFLLITEYDGKMTAAAVVLCFVAVYMTAHMLEQFRLGMTEDVQLASPVGLAVTLLLCLGGAAVWAPQLICAGSVALVDPATGVPVDKSLGSGMVFLAALVAVMLTFCGVMVACRDKIFCRSKAEILTLVKAEVEKRHKVKGKNASVKVTSQDLFNRAVTTDLRRIVLGGTLNGVGVVVSEYLILLSWVFRGGYVKWDTSLVATAAVAAVVGSIAAYWLIFRMLAVMPGYDSYRMLATTVLTATVCGSSYCSVLSARYVRVVVLQGPCKRPCCALQISPTFRLICPTLLLTPRPGVSLTPVAPCRSP